MTTYEIVFCGGVQTIATLGTDGRYRCVRCGKPVPTVVTGTTIEETVRLRNQEQGDS